MKPVTLRQHLVNRVFQSEHLHGSFVGMAWRTGDTISICLPASGRERARWETRPFVVVESAEDEWVPATWRDAARLLCLQRPEAAEGVTTFADLTRQERARMIAERLRGMAAQVLEYADSTPPGDPEGDLAHLVARALDRGLPGASGRRNPHRRG